MKDFKELQNTYLSELVASFKELQSKESIKIAELKSLFEINNDYQEKLSVLRSEILDGILKKYDKPLKVFQIPEGKYLSELLREFDYYSMNFSFLEEFIEINNKESLYLEVIKNFESIKSDKKEIKAWLIDNEDLFFKHWLYYIDYCYDEEENISNPHYKIILRNLGGNFIFDYNEFQNFTKFCEIFHYYYFVEELNPNSSRYEVYPSHRTSIYDIKTNIMNIEGKLIQILPLQVGMGKNGEWRKQNVILETNTKYPRKVCITIWGDKIDDKKLVVGNELKILVEAESREYNEKWYTDLRATEIANVYQELNEPIDSENTSSFFTDFSNNEEDKDDLPF